MLRKCYLNVVEMSIKVNVAEMFQKCCRNVAEMSK
jgi:hypothetical protein